MCRYLIHKGYEVIGKARTIEEAKAVCEEYCENSAGKCNLTFDLKRVLKDNDVTVFIFQYSTLYLETFVVSKDYEIKKK